MLVLETKVEHAGEPAAPRTLADALEDERHLDALMPEIRVLVAVAARRRGVGAQGGHGVDDVA